MSHFGSIKWLLDTWTGFWHEWPFYLSLTVRRDVQENDEEAVRVKEQSILELGTLLAKTGQAAGNQVQLWSSFCARFDFSNKPTINSNRTNSIFSHWNIWGFFIYIFCGCFQNWGAFWNLWGLSWFPSARPRQPGWSVLCWTSFLTWRQQQGRKLSCVLNALSGPRLRRELSYDRLWR